MEDSRCFVCGKRPDSFFVRVDNCVNRTCAFCSLFRVDVDRLLEDHPDASGIICLNCLSVYMRREPAPLASSC